MRGFFVGTITGGLASLAGSLGVAWFFTSHGGDPPTVDGVGCVKELVKIDAEIQRLGTAVVGLGERLDRRPLQVERVELPDGAGVSPEITSSHVASQDRKTRSDSQFCRCTCWKSDLPRKVLGHLKSIGVQFDAPGVREAVLEYAGKFENLDYSRRLAELDARQRDREWLASLPGGTTVTGNESRRFLTAVSREFDPRMEGLLAELGLVLEGLDVER